MNQEKVYIDLAVPKMHHRTHDSSSLLISSNRAEIRVGTCSLPTDFCRDRPIGTKFSYDGSQMDGRGD